MFFRAYHWHYTQSFLRHVEQWDSLRTNKESLEKRAFWLLSHNYESLDM